MRTRQHRWLVGLVLSLAACGGGGSLLDMSLSLRGLTGDVDGLRVEAWDMMPTCQQVRLTPRGLPDGARPLKALTFDLSSDEDALYELPDLEAGTYTIAVWALDDNMRVGFGCAPGVRVIDGEATEIAITLVDI